MSWSGETTMIQDGNSLMKNQAIGLVKPPETPDDLMQRAIKILVEAQSNVRRVSVAVAGHRPESEASEAPRTASDCFVDRHSDAMHEIIRIAADISNNMNYAAARLGG